MEHITRRIPNDLISFPLRQDSVMQNLSAVMPVILPALLSPAIDPQNRSWLHFWNLRSGAGQILIKWFIFLPVGRVDVDCRNILVLFLNASSMHCSKDFQNCARHGQRFSGWIWCRFASAILFGLFQLGLQAFNLFLVFIISLWSLLGFLFFLLFGLRLLTLVAFLLLLIILFPLLQLHTRI